MRTIIALFAAFALSACSGHGLLTSTYARAPEDPSIVGMKQVGPSGPRETGGMYPRSYGTLIGDHHVLTAAHNIPDVEYPLTGKKGRLVGYVGGDHFAGAEAWRDRDLDLAVLEMPNEAPGGLGRELKCSGDMATSGPVTIRNWLYETRTEISPHEPFHPKFVVLWSPPDPKMAPVSPGWSGSPVFDKDGNFFAVVISVRPGPYGQMNTVAARVQTACPWIKAAMAN